MGSGAVGIFRRCHYRSIRGVVQAPNRADQRLQLLGNPGIRQVRSIRVESSLYLPGRTAERDPVPRPRGVLYVEALRFYPGNDLRIVALAEPETLLQILRD